MGSTDLDSPDRTKHERSTSPRIEGKENKYEARKRKLSPVSYNTGRNKPVTLSIRRNGENTDTGEELKHEQASNANGRPCGVQRLADVIAPADELNSQVETEAGKSSDMSPASTREARTISNIQHAQHSLLLGSRQHDELHSLRPAALLPVEIPSPETRSSPMSTPKTGSMRSFQFLSDEEFSADETNSQAVCDDEDPQPSSEAVNCIENNSVAQDVPQLVMPSIRMPPTRVYTRKGLDLGTLKIMVAGRKGVGKTALTRSILQTSEDIVHVDPVQACANPEDHDISQSELPRNAKASRSHPSKSKYLEYRASSRPIPWWWGELEASRVLKRRYSFGDVVLERNVTIIDTPACTESNEVDDDPQGILLYLHHLARRNTDLGSLQDGELLKIFSGGGGSQVDLVLYLVSDAGSFSADVNMIRSISEVSNVLPILSKADLHTREHLEDAQKSMAQLLRSAGIKWFWLPDDPDGSTTDDIASIPTVSTAPLKDDDDSMDASLLMSSTYVPPLEPSNLSNLVDSLISPSTAACLRHCAIKKTLAIRDIHRQHTPPTSLDTNRPSLKPIGSLSTSSGPLTERYAPMPPAAESRQPSGLLPSSSWAESMIGRPSMGWTSDYMLARMTDHKQREERLAQAHLARWAADLQKSVREERARYTALQEHERRQWLNERLKECLSDDDNITKQDNTLTNRTALRTGSISRMQRQAAAIDCRDPLGLLAWQDMMSQRGLMLARVVGSLGIASAVMLWVMKGLNWGFDMSLQDLLARPLGCWPWANE